MSQFDPRRTSAYWVCMFISGTLGTVIGDFCSHNMGLDDAGASILLSPIMAVFHFRTQHARPVREHCRHGGSLHCRPGHLEGAVEIGERDPHRFLMRSTLRHNAPRGRGAAHGAVPRGRVTTGDGGGHDDAGMRRAQKHMSRRGRRNK